MHRLRELLESQRIRDSARTILSGARVQGKLAFHISKQAATVGRVNFSDGTHPLGDIRVEIVADDLDEVIDWLTSKEGEEQ